MRCDRCLSGRLERLAVLGQGTSRRYIAGCRDCHHVFGTQVDPEPEIPMDPEGEAAFEAQVEENRREARALIEAYAHLN